MLFAIVEIVMLDFGDWIVVESSEVAFRRASIFTFWLENTSNLCCNNLNYYVVGDSCEDCC